MAMGSRSERISRLKVRGQVRWLSLKILIDPGFESQRPHHCFLTVEKIIYEWKFSWPMNPAISKLQGIAGVDEAGRGPMIGPLVVCGVLVTSDILDKMSKLGIRDSKTLSAKMRESLDTEIRQLASKIEIESIRASEIDSLRAKKVTLNEIEVRAFVQVVKKLRPAKLYLDAADVKAERFGSVIGERSGLSSMGCKIVSEHKADSKYTVVAAASIVAKVKRDSEIRRLHKKFGDFGSGYPSDPKSIAFVKQLVQSGETLPDIIRTSWKSITRITEDSTTEQISLE